MSSINLSQMKLKESPELLAHIMSLHENLQRAKLHAKTLQKNLKTVIFKEAAEFLKEKTKIVSEILTKNHRKMVLQLLEARKLTFSKIQEVEVMNKRMIELELELTYRLPVNEAEYQIKRNKETGLYGCLIPRLKVKKKPTLKKKQKTKD